MSTQKSLDALEKTKEAVFEIKKRLKPVLERLKEDSFGMNATATGEVQATVALSLGMMRYMGARLQGLDQGRKPDDSLRMDLNNMKRILAEIKKRKPKLMAQESGMTKSSMETTKRKASGPNDELTLGQKQIPKMNSTIMKEKPRFNDENPSRNVTSEVTECDEGGQFRRKRSSGELMKEIDLLESTKPKTKPRII
jgi:hypothetical protein